MLCYKAGCFRKIWCYFKVSDFCKGNTDQDGSGCKAWRGRTSSGKEGLSVDS